VPSSSPLIDHLIAVGNKSGVIKGGPEALKGLKENIQSLPFEVGSRGISTQWAGGIFSILLGLLQKAAHGSKDPRVPTPPPVVTRSPGPDIPRVEDYN
jgi:hypothetical protein